MNPKHIMKLQGRDFVTYEGLLDAAHKAGLCQIDTTLVQAPSAENDQTAIVHATATLRDEETGLTKGFSGIGDATPRNTSRNVALHLIRMAETRAKARALRDAINVGMCAVEELETSDLGHEEGAPRGKEARDKQKETLTRPAAEDAASKPQIDKIGVEMKRVGWSPDRGRSWLQQTFSKQSRLELTKDEASKMLDFLADQPDAGASA